MQIKGEVRSAKVSKKIDDSGHENMVVDIRIKVPTGERLQIKEIIELAGHNAVLSLEKAQLTIQD